ncbi:hypothetical protein JW968_07515 [Candidatus Woesearchaeota archaeon]|nr:hypothetical protein [Candidatus Woesearchaeota archaeon]
MRKNTIILPIILLLTISIALGQNETPDYTDPQNIMNNPTEFSQYYSQKSNMNINIQSCSGCSYNGGTRLEITNGKIELNGKEYQVPPGHMTCDAGECTLSGMNTGDLTNLHGTEDKEGRMNIENGFAGRTNLENLEQVSIENDVMTGTAGDYARVEIGTKSVSLPKGSRFSLTNPEGPESILIVDLDEDESVHIDSYIDPDKIVTPGPEGAQFMIDTKNSFGILGSASFEDNPIQVRDFGNEINVYQSILSLKTEQDDEVITGDDADYRFFGNQKQITVGRKQTTESTLNSEGITFTFGSNPEISERIRSLTDSPSGSATTMTKAIASVENVLDNYPSISANVLSIEVMGEEDSAPLFTDDESENADKGKMPDKEDQQGVSREKFQSDLMKAAGESFAPEFQQRLAGEEPFVKGLWYAAGAMAEYGINHKLEYKGLKMGDYTFGGNIGQDEGEYEAQLSTRSKNGLEFGLMGKTEGDMGLDIGFRDDTKNQWKFEVKISDYQEPDDRKISSSASWTSPDKQYSLRVGVEELKQSEYKNLMADYIWRLNNNLNLNIRTTYGEDTEIKTGLRWIFGRPSIGNQGAIGSGRT